MLAKCTISACVALLFGCGRARSDSARTSSARTVVPVAEASAAARPAPTAPVVSPTRLATLPISAYATTLVTAEDGVYLLASHAAYRLIEGQPIHGIELELGTGATLTRSALVFWSKGGIWSAPKRGGEARRLAALAHAPQYFAAAGDSFAWVDQSEDGLYTIQTLAENRPKVLVSSRGELRALDMIGDAVYFVQRPSDDSWRLGVVHVAGGEPEYATPRRGRAPALLAGTDALYYYDLDTSKILQRSLDLQNERTQMDDVVCSPIHVSSRIFCGCVEGLFAVSKETREPTVLVKDPHGTITSISASSKLVAWTVDLGRDQMAVEMLPLPESAR